MSRSPVIRRRNAVPAAGIHSAATAAAGIAGRTPGLNAYCSAYQDFFSYAYPRLEEMARAVGR